MIKKFKGDPRNGVYHISVADAVRLLEEMHAKDRDDRNANRPVAAAHVRAIASDIERGAWLLNGEPLIFDEDGILVDGQHRLEAIRAANRGVDIYCVFGISRKAFPSIDIGRNRTAGDVAAVYGLDHYNLVGTTVRFLLGYDATSPDAKHIACTRRSIPNYLVADFIRKHRDAVEHAASLASKARRALPGMIEPGLIGFVYYKAREQNQGKADKWLDAIYSGLNLQATDSALVLRNKLMALAAEKRSTSASERVALLIKSWLAFRDGRPIKQLKWDKRETMPRFEDTTE